jgi:hypothetical protein
MRNGPFHTTSGAKLERTGRFSVGHEAARVETLVASAHQPSIVDSVCVARPPADARPAAGRAEARQFRVEHPAVVSRQFVKRLLHRIVGWGEVAANRAASPPPSTLAVQGSAAIDFNSAKADPQGGANTISIPTCRHSLPANLIGGAPEERNFEGLAPLFAQHHPPINHTHHPFPPRRSV